MSCISPVHIQSPLNNGKYIYVPCGRCAWCRRDKRNDWCTRFEIEMRNNMFTYFITLTYDEKNVPWYIDETDGVFEMSSKVSDVQKFIKRLRKMGHQFKYFFVSEYGPKNKRPHYHGIVFSQREIPADDIQNKWNMGFTSSYYASPGALLYVTKYILKGNDRDGNFMICSKRPAIGLDYVNEENAKNSYRKSDEDGLYHFSYAKNGNLFPMPRYYKKKFAGYFPELEFEMNKVAVINQMEERPKQYYLEKKFKKKGGLKHEESIKDVEEFNRILRVNYLRDYNKQLDINFKDNINENTI